MTSFLGGEETKYQKNLDETVDEEEHRVSSDI